MYLQKNDGFIIKVDVDQITPRPDAIIQTSTSRCHNHHLTIQKIAFSDRHPNIASSPSASCPTNSILSDIGTLISSLHSHSITHHSHLPEKSWQCLPNPVQSVISKRPNVNQQGPSSPPIHKIPTSKE